MILIMSVLLSFALWLPTMSYYAVASYMYGAYDHEVNGYFSDHLVETLMAQEGIEKVVPAATSSRATFITQSDRTALVSVDFFPEYAAADLSYSIFSNRVLFRGRHPRHEGEVAINTSLARDLGVQIGDEVLTQMQEEDYLPGKVVGIYSLRGRLNHSVITIISSDDLQMMGRHYNRFTDQYYEDNGYFELYPLMKNSVYYWMWISTSWTDVQLHEFLIEHNPDELLQVFSRKSMEAFALAELEYTPPVIIAVSIIGLIALLVLCHREAVFAKVAYMPIRALLSMLGARQKTLRRAIVLYELLGLLVSSAVAYIIIVNFNLGLFFGLDLPRMLRPWLVLSQALTSGVILSYAYIYTIFSTRQQLQVLADLHWEL